MAKLEIKIELNDEAFKKALKLFESNVFIYLSEFDSMESDLNCLGITTSEENDKDRD